QRADEFAMRLAGAGYEEIARAGGGIVSTVRATRAADEDTLFALAAARLAPLLAEGVTTLEIKSGYGLDLASERKQLRVARRLGVKLHAEQLSNLGGTALAARYRALSADHLEHLDEAGVAAMAESGTVAVLLPGAYYFLRDTNLPPIALLRQHGVPMAISTDH